MPLEKENLLVLLLVGDSDDLIFDTLIELVGTAFDIKKIRLDLNAIRESIDAYAPNIITFAHNGENNTAFIDVIRTFKDYAYKSIIISTSHFREIEEVVCQAGYAEYWYSPIGIEVLEKRIDSISNFSKKVTTLNTNCFNAEDKRPRLLIVEDNEYDRILLEETLRKDYDLVFAESAREALSSISASREAGFEIAGIILDVFLPGENGFNVFESVKADDQNINIPIIFSTSKTSWRDVLYGLNLGAADYLKKPIQPFRVLSKVNAAINRSRIEQIWLDNNN